MRRLTSGAVIGVMLATAAIAVVYGFLNLRDATETMDWVEVSGVVVDGQEGGVTVRFGGQQAVVGAAADRTWSPGETVTIFVDPDQTTSAALTAPSSHAIRAMLALSGAAGLLVASRAIHRRVWGHR